jgi:MFS family permease
VTATRDTPARRAAAAAKGPSVAVGVVALEFAAATQAFVASTLLPVIARDLGARTRLALLLAGTTIGLFVALPLAGRVVRRLGVARTSTLGLSCYVGGSVLAATAPTPAVFALGQASAGFGGGLLAVFGVSALIRHLGARARARVVAASSAMWIAPALVGPAATLALERVTGWRWALLLPVPIAVAGRLLVARAASYDAASAPPARPLGRTLLVPAGATVLVAGSAWPSWPAALAGAVVVSAGVTGLLPRGTSRAAPGAPAALAAMTLFATGYFGADSLVTVLFTDGYGVALSTATIGLSAAPLAWALTSLAAGRLVRSRRGAAAVVAGLALTAAAAGALALLAFGAVVPAAIAAWALGGAGVGLAYPGLYVRCTTPSADHPDAVALATAVITAEAFGGLLGRAVGGSVVSLAVASGLSPRTGLVAAYAMFAGVLALGSSAAARAGGTLGDR